MDGDRMTNLRIKGIFRIDRNARKVRLFRVAWESGDGPGTGRGHSHSAKVSVGLAPTLCNLRWESDGWRAAVLGITAHYRESHGGTFA
jgi:hypothetical protein